MRFLVDAQLPPALARWLADQGHAAEHVIDQQLESADDRDIWNYALQVEAVIVTKDEDFATRRSLMESGPRIIWIRRGNTSRRDLLAWFSILLPDILDALEREEIIVEIV